MADAETKMDLVPRRADAEGTLSYSQTFAAVAAPGHFRKMKIGGNVGNLMVSSLGLGTYLGPETDEADIQYECAIKKALSLGINVLDSAINYRNMRSEIAMGRAIASAVSHGIVKRNQIVVCTKGGYLSFGLNRPANPRSWIEENYIKPGIFSWADFVAGCHCMSPTYIKDQLEKSRKNLGLETIDIFYVHNPETQLNEVSNDEFYKRIQDTFAALEGACGEGKISTYGTATWNGFRVPPQSKGHLSLERLVQAAQRAGGENHHFKVIQLPFNLSLQEAALTPTQVVKDRPMPLLDAAKELGISVVASASLMQAKLCKGLPHSVKMQHLTDAQAALQFVRTTPNIVTALAGMRNVAHVEENAGVIAIPSS